MSRHAERLNPQRAALNTRRINLFLQPAPGDHKRQFLQLLACVICSQALFHAILHTPTAHTVYNNTHRGGGLVFCERSLPGYGSNLSLCARDRVLKFRQLLMLFFVSMLFGNIYSHGARAPLGSCERTLFRIQHHSIFSAHCLANIVLYCQIMEENMQKSIGGNGLTWKRYKFWYGIDVKQHTLFPLLKS